MSKILCIYSEEPKFPEKDQHPDAVRYKVGKYWVDVLGSKPTLAAVEKILKGE